MGVPVLNKFIVFEGIDGAGKSTQIRLLSEYFKPKNVLIHSTREPHDGITGTIIREVLSSRTKKSVQKDNFLNNYLAYLFATDRYEHVYGPGGIIESLEAYQCVISDRYVFSSLAYQGNSDTTSLTHVLNSHFPLPELLIYFDISPDNALQRIQSKNKDLLENKENLEKVHARYKNIIEDYKISNKEMKIIHIDANLHQDIILHQLIGIIENTLRK